MSDKTAAELEQDAAVARASVADTAESIRSKMSPGQLIDEFAGLFSGGDGSAALSNLKAQIRDNPLPLAMVGAGLAWLMLGQGASARNEGHSFNKLANTTTAARSDFITEGGTQYDEHPAQPGEEGSVGDFLSSAAESVASVVGGAASAVQGAASQAGERIGNSASATSSAAVDATQRTAQAAQDLFQREPLTLAALGLAVGTAIGALLPRTDLEDEQMGRYGDKVRSAADDLLEKGIEEAKGLAAEAYQTLKDEADRHGLAGDADTSIVEKVGEVVKSAAKKTEKAVRERGVNNPTEKLDKG